MNNLNPHPQNQNIQNSLPLNNNILNEIIKNNQNSLLQINNSNNTNNTVPNPNIIEPLQNPSPNNEIINKLLQNQMFANILNSNLPLINGLIKTNNQNNQCGNIKTLNTSQANQGNSERNPDEVNAQQDTNIPGIEQNNNSIGNSCNNINDMTINNKKISEGNNPNFNLQQKISISELDKTENLKNIIPQTKTNNNNLENLINFINHANNNNNYHINQNNFINPGQGDNKKGNLLQQNYEQQKNKNLNIQNNPNPNNNILNLLEFTYLLMGNKQQKETLNNNPSSSSGDNNNCQLTQNITNPMSFAGNNNSQNVNNSLHLLSVLGNMCNNSNSNNNVNNQSSIPISNNQNKNILLPSPLSKSEEVNLIKSTNSNNNDNSIKSNPTVSNNPGNSNNMNLNNAINIQSNDNSGILSGSLPCNNNLANSPLNNENNKNQNSPTGILQNPNSANISNNNNNILLELLAKKFGSNNFKETQNNLNNNNLQQGNFSAFKHQSQIPNLQGNNIPYQKFGNSNNSNTSNNNILSKLLKNTNTNSLNLPITGGNNSSLQNIINPINNSNVTNPAPDLVSLSKTINKLVENNSINNQLPIQQGNSVTPTTGNLNNNILLGILALMNNNALKNSNNQQTKDNLNNSNPTNNLNTINPIFNNFQQNHKTQNNFPTNNNPNLLKNNNPLSNLLNFLNVSNDLNQQGKGVFTKNHHNQQNQNENFAQDPEDISKNLINPLNEGISTENSINSLIKLNSNQNNVTNFNIFNNLFNIPMHYQKNLGNGNNQNSNGSDFKNNLINFNNISKFTNPQNLSNFQKFSTGNNTHNLAYQNNPNNSAFSFNNNQNNKSSINLNLLNNIGNSTNNFQNKNNSSDIIINNLVNSNPMNMSNYISGSNKQGNKPCGAQIDFKNISANSAQGNFCNIQNNLNNLSDKQSFVKQIKYPVEDMDLFKDSRNFSIDSKIYLRPEGSKVQISDCLSTKIILIWDFLSNFNKLVMIDEEILTDNFFGFFDKINCEYFPNKIKFPEEINSEKKLNEKNYENFEKLLIQLIKLFSTSLSELDLMENLKIDKDLFVIKFCSENNFIELESFYSKCYPEILKMIVNSKRFCLMATEEIKSYIENDLKYLNTAQRIEIFFYLINSAYDLHSIKQTVKLENESKNDLLRERNTLDYEMKTKENRKREIEKMEKFLTAPAKIELLTERINKLDENPEEILKIYKETNVVKLKKDLDIERERYKSLLKENEELTNVKTKILTRLDEIRVELNNLNFRNKKKIGQDYKKNDYYIFDKIQNYLFIYTKNSDNKSDIGIINSKTSGGKWFYHDCYENILNLSNLLSEKGIREKNLKSSLKKLLSKKFFSNEPKIIQSDVFSFSELNEKYKNFENYSQVQQEILPVGEKDLNNINITYLIPTENLEELENKNLTKGIKSNIISLEKISEIEKNNKILQEIIVDIQNIDEVNNNLENILDNEYQINSANMVYQEKLVIQPDVEMKIEENLPTEIEGKNVESQKIQTNLTDGKKITNICENIDLKMDFEIIDKKEKIENYFETEENKNELNFIKEKILILEDKFSEYLKQYEKEWELPTTRFKNPYRSDEPPASDDEIEKKEDLKIFSFKVDKEEKIFNIFEFDNTRLLAPKGKFFIYHKKLVKIWSRDLEINEMEKYFCDNILERINNLANLYIAYFLFEGAVYSLIKRRDPYKKSSYREMSLGGIDNNCNMNYASSSINLMNNNNNLQGLNENGNNLNNSLMKQENENCGYFENNNEESFKQNDRSNEKKFSNNSFNNHANRTRSTRLINPVNYNINYNLNSIFNQPSPIDEIQKPLVKMTNRCKKADKSVKDSSLTEDSKNKKDEEEEKEYKETEEDIKNNPNNEEENEEETLSDDQAKKKMKLKKSDIKKKLSKKKFSQTEENEKNNLLNNTDLILPEESEKTDTLSEKNSDASDENYNFSNNAKKKNLVAEKNKKFLTKKKKRIQDEVKEDIISIKSYEYSDEEVVSKNLSEKNKKINLKKFCSNSEILNNISEQAETNKNFNPSGNENKILVGTTENNSLITNKKLKNKITKISEISNDNRDNRENSNEESFHNEKNKKNLNLKNLKNINNEINLNSENNKNELISNIDNINNKSINKNTIKITKPVSRYLNKNFSDEKFEDDGSNKKRHTRRTNNEEIKGKWKETCYICFDYGDLICCDRCSNVAHKFCACVDKIPDKWECERCLEKNPKRKDK